MSSSRDPGELTAWPLFPELCDFLSHNEFYLGFHRVRQMTLLMQITELFTMTNPFKNILQFADKIWEITITINKIFSVQ